MVKGAFSKGLRTNRDQGGGPNKQGLPPSVGIRSTLARLMTRRAGGPPPPEPQTFAINDLFFNGVILTLAVTANRIYVAGKFAMQTPKGVRNNIAEFDLQGELFDSSTPRINLLADNETNVTVNAIHIAGGVVYVGGHRSSVVNDIETQSTYLRVFSETTGALLRDLDGVGDNGVVGDKLPISGSIPALRANLAVNAILVQGNVLYVGGQLNVVQAVGVGPPPAVFTLLHRFTINDAVNPPTYTTIPTNPAIDFNVNTNNDQAQTRIHKLGFDTGKLYVGGNFTLGGDPFPLRSFTNPGVEGIVIDTLPGNPVVLAGEGIRDFLFQGDSVLIAGEFRIAGAGGVAEAGTINLMLIDKESFERIDTFVSPFPSTAGAIVNSILLDAEFLYIGGKLRINIPTGDNVDDNPSTANAILIKRKVTLTANGIVIDAENTPGNINIRSQNTNINAAPTHAALAIAINNGKLIIVGDFTILQTNVSDVAQFTIATNVFDPRSRTSGNQFVNNIVTLIPVAPEPDGGGGGGGGGAPVGTFKNINNILFAVNPEVDPTNPFHNTVSSINAVAVSATSIHAGGGFFTTHGEAIAQGVPNAANIIKFAVNGDTLVVPLVTPPDAPAAQNNVPSRITLGAEGVTVNAIHIADGLVYVGGQKTVGTIRTTYLRVFRDDSGALLATLDGSDAINTLPNVVNNNVAASPSVNAILVQDGVLYVGGQLTGVAGTPAVFTLLHRFTIDDAANPPTYETIPTNNAIAFNISGTGDSRIHKLGFDNDKLYVGGDFSFGGDPFTLRSFTNPGVDTIVIDTLPATPVVLSGEGIRDFLFQGTHVLIAGEFRIAGAEGVTVPGTINLMLIHKTNFIRDAAFESPIVVTGGIVNSIKLDRVTAVDGRLYIGGHTLSTDENEPVESQIVLLKRQVTLTINGIAMVNPDEGNFPVQGNFPDNHFEVYHNFVGIVNPFAQVTDIALQPDHVVIVGDFRIPKFGGDGVPDNANEQNTRNSIARFNKDGTIDPLYEGVGVSTVINVLPF